VRTDSGGGGFLDLDKLTDIAERLCQRMAWAKPVYIDNGASAAVYSTEMSDGPAALKIYDPTFFEGSNALIETKRIALQKQLRNHGCKNLVEVLDADEIPEDGTWYLLMEFCPWSSLDKQLSRVPDANVHNLIKQLINAVKFLEARSLVHRDIKPANIVVSNDFTELKLLDFGVMRNVAFDEGSGTDGYKFIATAQYSPPEFLLREEEPGEAGFNAINLYQVGAVLHDLIMKTAVFGEEKATKNKFILYKAVTEKKPRIMSDTVSTRLIALCLAALDKQPEKRAASVTLDDFLADVDDLDALRRRIAHRPSTNSSKLKAPLLTTWEGKIRSWGKDAAHLESETLGSVTMKREALPDGIRWRLEFKDASAPIYLELAKVDNLLEIYVLSDPDAERRLSVFRIDGDGVSLPESGIAGAIAAQYLYALDRALTERQSN
jgi:serine/threonine protein kinase